MTISPLKAARATNFFTESHPYPAWWPNRRLRPPPPPSSAPARPLSSFLTPGRRPIRALAEWPGCLRLRASSKHRLRVRDARAHHAVATATFFRSPISPSTPFSFPGGATGTHRTGLGGPRRVNQSAVGFTALAEPTRPHRRCGGEDCSKLRPPRGRMQQVPQPSRGEA